ncbi:MAG: hypothetical protein QM724_10655 [Flavobacteriales bacterium]
MKIERMFRSWRYPVLSIFAQLLCLIAAAQSGLLRVTVLDSLDDCPIPDVELTFGERSRARTDVDGSCTIGWVSTAPMTVRFSHVAYGEHVRTLLPGTALHEGTWVVRLPMRTFTIPDVQVGRSRPEPVFQRQDLHAADLLINDEGIWVLAYEHPRLLRAEADAAKEILRDVRLVLLDTTYAEVASCPVPEDVFGLRHDLRNDVVVEGTRRAFSVERWSDGRISMQPFGLEDLRRAVLPWTDTIPGWVLGSNGDGVLPAFDHLAYDPCGDTAVVICSVVDTFMMDLFRSSYKYLSNRDKVMAMDLAAELHVDKAIVAGYMSGFQHNAWSRPVYAPLFVAGDTLLVFDHACGKLRKFTRSFAKAGERPLTYLGKGDRKDKVDRLIQDRATQRIYAASKRLGVVWLRAIDPVTGELGDRFRISSEYPERVQVHDGWVYYIHRPYGSLQKRTIYRERIR